MGRAGKMLVGVLVFALWMVAPAHSFGEEVERWYVVAIDGSPSGWMRSVEHAENGLITTEIEMTLSLKRGAATITIFMGSETVETLDGEPISGRALQRLGGMDTITEYRFREDEIEIVAGQGEDALRSTVRLPEDGWLMPAAAGRVLLARVAAGETTIEQRVFDPLSGAEPPVVTRRDPVATHVVLGGERIDGTRWTVESSSLPGIVSTEVVDGEGYPLESVTSLGAFRLTMTRATKELAMAAASGDPAEMMVATFVRPSVAIDRPRETTGAEFRVWVDGGVLPGMPTGGGQRFERVDESSGLVWVDATLQSKRGDGAVALKEDLAPSSMINSEDKVVRDLHGLAVDGLGDDAALRAHAMRGFVYRIIDAKDLGTALGSASEVARSRSGDCTEHAVLLAALLRADGIPARVVSGLIYAEAFAGQKNIFGYHMWTRGLVQVDGVQKWVDFDATLPGETRFDATHIALGESALADGTAFDAFGGVAVLLGRLRIEVRSVEH